MVPLDPSKQKMENKYLLTKNKNEMKKCTRENIINKCIESVNQQASVTDDTVKAHFS